MTIKSRLIANVLLTAVIVVAISLISFFSMRFIQEKLSYLTKRSTPFQMRTIELQRELQRYINTLNKVKASRNMTEFTTFRAEVENSLAIVKNIQKSVENTNDDTTDVSAELDKMIQRSLSQIVGVGLTAIVIVILLGFWIYRSVLWPLRVILDAVRLQQEQGNEKARLAEAVAGGDLTQTVTVSEAIALDTVQMNNDEMGMVLNAIVGMSEAQVTLDRAFAEMTVSLRSSRDEEVRRDRLKNGLYDLNKILRGEQKTAEMADRALAFLTSFLCAGVGIIYLYDEKGEMLQTLSTYAISRSKRLNWGFRLGEGLPGQVALERKMIYLNTVPPDYLPITSTLGEADPLGVAILPIMHNDTLVGVLELGSFRQLGNDDFEFLNQSLEEIAIAINVNCSRQQVNELLDQAQAQAEELRVQQEELLQSNEELEERARMLAEQRNYNIY